MKLYHSLAPLLGLLVVLGHPSSVSGAKMIRGNPKDDRSLLLGSGPITTPDPINNWDLDLCGFAGSACEEDDDCCDGQSNAIAYCSDDNTCQECIPPDQQCTDAVPCCESLFCDIPPGGLFGACHQLPTDAQTETPTTSPTNAPTETPTALPTDVPTETPPESSCMSADEPCNTSNDCCESLICHYVSAVQGYCGQTDAPTPQPTRRPTMPPTPRPTQPRPVWEDITSDDFESGWGNFDPVENPNDQWGAIRVSYANGNDFGTRQQEWIPGGQAALRIRGGSSVELRDHYDVTECTRLRIKFSFAARSMEDDEMFFLEYSSNNGTTWQSIRKYIKGTKLDGTKNFYFDNDTVYNQGVTLNSWNTTEAKIRFRCDDGAFGKGDFIYIDDVEFLCGK